MFTQTLLDSSPLRAPVLKKGHLAISLIAGVLGSNLAWFGLPMLLAQPATNTLVTQSAMVGVVLMLSALMICYVWADARHLNLRAWLWTSITLAFNLVGFLAYLVYSACKTGNWRRATLPAAHCFEVVLVSALVLVPLVHTEVLPRLLTGVALLPPPPPGPPRAARSGVKAPRNTRLVDLKLAPIVIPRQVAQVGEEPSPPQETSLGTVGVVPGGATDGGLGGIFRGIGNGAEAPPPPMPRPTEKRIIRIRPGGQVEPPKLIFQPKPEYPPLARMARIQGVVRLEAIINRDGTVQDLTLLSGHPLLVKAAFDAVSRWRYEPTRLNGQPVEVVMEFDVKFNLNE